MSSELKPYKGPEFYKEEDDTIFFGREEEISNIFRLVRLNILTLIYGKSGIGKTSLLNAGLLPLMRRNNYFPVYLRLLFDDPAEKVVDNIISIIEREAEEHKIHINYKNNKKEDTSLWQYLHTTEFFFDKRIPQVPVLIFDQFEELYKKQKYNPAYISRLIEELGFLIENVPPPYLKATRAQVKDKSVQLSHINFIEQNYRVIFSFRDDSLSDMEKLLQTIPRIYNSRENLESLTREAARHVILNPVKSLNPGNKEWINEKQADNLLDFILESNKEQAKNGSQKTKSEVVVKPSDEKAQVDPIVLSILCTELFRKYPELVPDDALHKEKLSNIIREFVTNILKDKSHSVIEFIENELVDNVGTRIHTYYGAEKIKLFLNEIDELVEQKLLRKAKYLEKEYVEITHDRLANIVFENKVTKKEQQKKFNKRLKYIIFLLISAILLYSYFTSKKTENLEYINASQDSAFSEIDSLNIGSYSNAKNEKDYLLKFRTIDSFSRLKDDSLRIIRRKLEEYQKQSSNLSSNNENELKKLKQVNHQLSSLNLLLAEKNKFLTLQLDSLEYLYKEQLSYSKDLKSKISELQKILKGRNENYMYEKKK